MGPRERKEIESRIASFREELEEIRQSIAERLGDDGKNLKPKQIDEKVNELIKGTDSRVTQAERDRIEYLTTQPRFLSQDLSD